MLNISCNIEYARESRRQNGCLGTELFLSILVVYPCKQKVTRAWEKITFQTPSIFSTECIPLLHHRKVEKP